MSEAGQMWTDHRKQSQEKRASNREASAELLSKAGVSFESKNHGAHLVVASNFDFWPGTGLWSHRQSRETGRGVNGLLARLRKAGVAK